LFFATGDRGPGRLVDGSREAYTSRPMSDTVYDVIIIGGGPAGATAALYTARAELKTLVFDKAIRAGALGITGKIANYPGIKEVLSGEELLRRMREHAELYGAKFIKSKVTGTVLTQDPKQVFSAEGEVYQAKAVIVATGSMGRSQTVPGEQELLGKGVSYCATCDGAFYKGQEVMVYGSSEETADEALFLTRYASKVFLVTPKPKLDVHEPMHAKLAEATKIEILTKTRLKSIAGEEGVDHAVLIKTTGEEKLPVKGVFIFTQGGKPIIDFIGGQLELNAKGGIKVNEEMATSVPGVFACGDMLVREVQQAVVAAGEGCLAALSADKFINKRTTVAKDYK